MTLEPTSVPTGCVRHTFISPDHEVAGKFLCGQAGRATRSGRSSGPLKSAT